MELLAVFQVCKLTPKYSSILMVRHGYPRWIVLGAALVHEEIVVTAADLLAGVIAAGGGSGFVDGAAAFFGVKKLADAAEVFVGFATH